MDRKRVIRRLGKPDRIITAEERLTSCAWKCSRCKSITMAAAPIPVPSPCTICGGIDFEKIDLVRH